MLGSTPRRPELFVAVCRGLDSPHRVVIAAAAARGIVRRVRDRRGLAGGLLASLLTLAAAIALRRFVVDDAWIPARYAEHLAGGLGYRFNAGGAVTDGVTPLPWAPWLAVWVRLGAPALLVARATSLLGMLTAAWLVGRAVALRDGGFVRFAPLLVFGSAPVGAWAVGGLETGAVVALVAAGVTAARATVSTSALGLAAALRPECLPMVVVLAVARPGTHAARGARGLAAAAPFAAVVGARLACFGSPVPLSVLAKPADLSHGWPYVAAGLLLLGAPAFAIAPRALTSPSQREARWQLASVIVHAGAVAWAGGDWMPLSRLLLPALPPLVLAGAALASDAPPWLGAARAAVCAGALAFAWATGGRASMADIAGTREALIELARGPLRDRRSVAALDVGWVSAATRERVVDLAGLTDPAIAALPGGHTSKQIPAAFLDDRGVDSLVLLRRRGCGRGCVRGDGGPFERAVEARLAEDPWVAERFVVGATVSAGPLTYVVLTRR